MIAQYSLSKVYASQSDSRGSRLHLPRIVLFILSGTHSKTTGYCPVTLELGSGIFLLRLMSILIRRWSSSARRQSPSHDPIILFTAPTSLLMLSGGDYIHSPHPQEYSLGRREKSLTIRSAGYYGLSCRPRYEDILLSGFLRSSKGRNEKSFFERKANGDATFKNAAGPHRIE
jgi:hypothetical protein